MILNWSKNPGFYHNSHLHKIPAFQTHKNNYNWIDEVLRRGAYFNYYLLNAAIIPMAATTRCILLI